MVMVSRSRTPGVPRAARAAAITILAAWVLGLMVTGGRALIALGRDANRTGDPFAGVRMFVDPHSAAAAVRATLAKTDPPAAAALEKIASQPTGIWLGGWIPASQVAAVARTVLREAGAAGSMPLLVLYAYPYHGCAATPAAAAAAYERWVGQVAAGIGDGRAAVILEPDALAQEIRLGCLSPATQAARIAVIRRAVGQLARLPHLVLYIDAGNSHWQSAPAMASLLLAAGVRQARGFSLNVSNFYPTGVEESYGDRIGALLHGAHYVIDTSRNGLATAKTWCNPPGQKLGVKPTAKTGRALADALLWIKPPGVSDGTCQGGPPAGVFWTAYALGLAGSAHP